MHCPTVVHWIAAKRLLKYLHDTQDLGILMHKTDNLVLNGYWDVDWATCFRDRRSTSGLCVFLENLLISWSFGKHKMVSISSTEVEFKALAQTIA